MNARPKTGERRKVRQPLRIDALSEAVRDQIQQLRREGKTWEEIEALSPGFAGERLAKSTLHRWWDLRVEQVQKEVLARAESARSIATAFASRGFKELPEAVTNALGDMVFSLMESSDGKQMGLARAELANLGWLLVQNKKVDIQQRKVNLEEKKLSLLQQKADRATHDAAEKLGKGKELTLADINRIRERTFGLPPIQR